MTYAIYFSPRARRALHVDLPEAVAAACAEFIFGPLAENPHRVGKPLRDEEQRSRLQEHFGKRGPGEERFEQQSMHDGNGIAPHQHVEPEIEHDRGDKRQRRGKQHRLSRGAFAAREGGQEMRHAHASAFSGCAPIM